MPLTLQSDVSLAPFNTFGIAARARWFVRVGSVETLRELREESVWRGEPRLVLGGGSNLLFTGDFDGLVVHVASKGRAHLGDDGHSHLVAAEAGEEWDGFVRDTVRDGFPGLENLALIPGTVGASPVQNIGAYGVELAERFAWLETLDVETGVVSRLTRDDCAFAYRGSVFKHALRARSIITRVVFRLPIAWEPRLDYADLQRRVATMSTGRPTPGDIVDTVTAIRREKLPDPAAIGNAGSFFKNPVVSAEAYAAIRSAEPDAPGHRLADGRVKLSAAWLIDRCGWRGRSLAGSPGRAAVHERHALVLVNRGGATGVEVLALATAIRDSVQQRFAMVLEIEPSVV